MMNEYILPLILISFLSGLIFENNWLLYPRAMGDSSIIKWNSRVLNASTSSIITRGTYIPQGLWCLDTPTCSNCQDCNTCGAKCPLCYLNAPKCRKNCEDRTLSLSTPGIYSIILAISGAYLLAQAKLLMLLWQPHMIDIIEKTYSLYKLDLQNIQNRKYIIKNEKANKTTNCYQNVLQPCSKTHNHHLIGTISADSSNFKILEYLSWKDLMICNLVSTEWAHSVSVCNKLWKIHLDADFPTVWKKFPIKSFKSIYKQEYQYLQSIKQVENYERRCNAREENYSFQLSKNATLEYLRSFTSYTSVFTIFWQHFEVMVHIFQWTSWLCVTLILIYLLTIGRVQLHHNVCYLFYFILTSVSFILLGALVFKKSVLEWSQLSVSLLSGIVPLIILYQNTALLQIGWRRIYGITMTTVGVIMMIFSLILYMNKKYDMKYEANDIDYSIITRPVTHPSMFLAVACAEIIVGSLIFFLRSSSWIYLIIYGILVLLEEVSFSIKLTQIIRPALAVILIEFVLNYMGFTNSILIVIFESVGQFVFCLLRVVISIQLLIGTTLFLCWFQFSKVKRQRKILMRLESRNLVKIFTKYIIIEGMVWALEYIFYKSFTPVYQLIGDSIWTWTIYLHWSRSVTFLMAMQLCDDYQFFRNKSFKFYSCLGCIWQISFSILSFGTLVTDLIHDYKDQPSQYQPKMDIVWLFFYFFGDNCRDLLMSNLSMMKTKKTQVYSLSYHENCKKINEIGSYDFTNIQYY